MKCYILFAALVLAVVAEVKSDHKEDVRKIVLACGEELHVNQDEFDAVFKSGMKDEPKEDIKCHMKCIMEKLGQWKNGAFDAESARKQVQNIPELNEHHSEIVKTIDECKDKKGANDCDTAYLIAKCIFEHHQSSL